MKNYNESQALGLLLLLYDRVIKGYVAALPAFLPLLSDWYFDGEVEKQVGNERF